MSIRSDFMDWVLLCSIFVVLAGFILDIIKSCRDTSKLSSEHKNLYKEHSGLSKGHDKITEVVKEQIRSIEKDTDRIREVQGYTNNFISKQSDILNSIDKTLHGEIQKRNYQFDNLTVQQNDAYKQLEKFTFLFEEVKRLQTENVQKDIQINKLLAENSQLQEALKIQENDSFTQEMN